MATAGAICPRIEITAAMEMMAHTVSTAMLWYS
jgi:hypothetical protein